ncbi:MAG: ABC transporter ATP-binding protein [Clostridiales bacterium]|nr:ABC transporter ATP-binding protein [Candidatus Cacconaster stercorequi]
MAEVILKHLRKVYSGSRTAEDVVAVQDFDLTIQDGECVVLLGPSGCGKSTTLRMVAGLEKITDGELYIGGKLMNNVESKERNLAMVFQNYALYPHMTVYENMAFPLQMKKMSQNAIDARVRQAAELLDITPYLHRKPHALSGGQCQRVAIGRAIVRKAQVFLMDEPLSNLDARLRNQMREELIRLRRKLHATFLYVTHDQTEALTLGDRIVVMRQGSVQQIGTPQEVFQHPANLFVASFIGTPPMNFFPDARLVRSGDIYYVEILGKLYCLPDVRQEALRRAGIAEKDIIAGIRPHHIHIGSGGSEAMINMVEMMGEEYHLHLTASDYQIVAVVPNAQFSDGATQRPSMVRFDLDTAQIHLFDKETQRNMEDNARFLKVE